MTTKNLDKVFNVESSESKELTTMHGSDVSVIPTGEFEKNVDYDYDSTRSNLYGLINQGQDALIHALDVAKQSEHPRAFEVVGNLLKQLADMNHQLLDLSEKRQKMTAKMENANDGGTTITNNTAYFVGSTMELNKMLKDIGEK